MVRQQSWPQCYRTCVALSEEERYEEGDSKSRTEAIAVWQAAWKALPQELFKGGLNVFQPCARDHQTGGGNEYAGEGECNREFAPGYSLPNFSVILAPDKTFGTEICILQVIDLTTLPRLPTLIKPQLCHYG